MARRHRRREIERLLRERERRGLTYRELSEQSGIPMATLAWWARKLEREAEDTDSGGGGYGLVPVEVVEDELDAQEAVIEIALGDGLRVLVPPAAGEEHLRRVLRVVASC